MPEGACGPRRSCNQVPGKTWQASLTPPKGARGAGQVRRIQENSPGFCSSHAVQAPKPIEFCPSHAVQDLKPAGFCPSHAVQALKLAGFCLSHAVQALKLAGFCPSHAVQAPKGARGAGQVCRIQENKSGFCYSHGMQGPK